MKNILRLPNNRFYLIAFSAALIATALLHLYWTSFSIHEMWFDEGSNYYYAAKNVPHWWQVLLYDDSGYLNTPPRLISLLLVRVLGISASFPVLFKVLNLVFFGLSMAILLSKRFDKYFGDNVLIRIGILFLCALFPHSDFGFPFNSSYACIVPILYIAAVLFDGKPINKTLLIALYVLMPLFFLSKIPLALLGVVLFSYAILKNICTKNRSFMLFSGWGLMCCLMQVLYYYVFYRQYYIDTSTSLPLFQLLNNSIGVSLSLYGISMFGYAFKMIEQHESMVFELITFCSGCFLASYMVISAIAWIKAGKLYLVEMVSLLTVLIVFTSLLLLMNRSYAHSWNMLYTVSSYQLHRHIWLGFVSVLLIIGMLVRNGKYARTLFSYMLIVIVSSIIILPFSINYLMASSLPHSELDLLVSDWRSMSKVSIMRQAIMVNNYNKNVFPKLVPIDFSNPKVFNFPKILASEGDLILILRINGSPGDAKNIVATVTYEGGHVARYHPLYYSKKSRFLFFDLGRSGKLVNVSLLKITAQGTVKNGWIDFMVYNAELEQKKHGLRF